MMKEKKKEDPRLGGIATEQETWIPKQRKFVDTERICGTNRVLRNILRDRQTVRLGKMRRAVPDFIEEIRLQC